MILYIISLIILFGVQPILCAQPQIQIEQGSLKGLYNKTLGGRTIATYLGVPYAKPLFSKDKFKEAVPAGPWMGVFNATRYSSSCLQVDPYIYITPSGLHGVEDCLYLNIYTPKVTMENETDKLYDVIVFIHGGGFVTMTSTFYQPSLLLDRDIVLVTFNYRTGPLGFLSTEDKVLPGNNGLKDQVLAMKWVQKNIRAFGGNPGSITLAGLSAGAVSVHYHMLSPLSKGLFHKAIMMSGAALNPWAQVEKANEKTKYIANELGCSTNNNVDMVKCLEERPSLHIVDVARNFQKCLHSPFSPTAPIIEHNGENDEAFINRKPMDIIKDGSYNDVPILMSYVDGEGIYPGSVILHEKNLNFMKKEWDHLIPTILECNHTAPEARKVQIAHDIKKEYQINLDEYQGTKNFIEMLGDRLFVSGIYKAVKAHASQKKSPVYFYKFSYVGKHTGSHLVLKEFPGAFQGDDLLYILYSKFMSCQETENDRIVSKQMLDMWTSFAANGTLSKPWLSVTEEYPKIPYINIKGPDNFKLEYAEDIARESFWDSLSSPQN